MVCSSSRVLTSSDGTEIYADAIGDPTKPAIVFVHGFTLSAAVFDNVFINDMYTKEFYLVRYDLRGHGRSGKPETAEGYASHLFADDFLVVLKSFNLTRPVFVGWSYGATVLVDIATHLSDNTLAGGVYLAGVPYIGPVMDKIGKSKELHVNLLEEHDVALANRSTIKFVQSMFLDQNASWEKMCLFMGMSLSQSPQDRIFTVTRPQSPDKLYELGGQGFPLLVVNGTHDVYIDGSELVKEVEPHFKNLQVHAFERGGSHALHIENEEEVMFVIASFVRQVASKVRSLHPEPILLLFTIGDSETDASKTVE